MFCRNFISKCVLVCLRAVGIREYKREHLKQFDSSDFFPLFIPKVFFFFCFLSLLIWCVYFGWRVLYNSNSIFFALLLHCCCYTYFNSICSPINAYEKEAKQKQSNILNKCKQNKKKNEIASSLIWSQIHKATFFPLQFHLGSICSLFILISSSFLIEYKHNDVQAKCEYFEN